MDNFDTDNNCSDEWTRESLSQEELLEEKNNILEKSAEDVDNKIGEGIEVIYDLEERAKSLQDTMKLLRQELSEELNLLKKEQDEYNHLCEEKIIQDFQDMSEAAKAASEAYAAESNYRTKKKSMYFHFLFLLQYLFKFIFSSKIILTMSAIPVICR